MRQLFTLPTALLLTLLPPLVLAEQPSARWQALCEAQLPPTVVEVTAEPAPVRHRRDRSIADLMQIQRLPQENAFTLGLTELQLGTRIAFRSPTLSHPLERLVCMRPAITVTLSLDPHVVSVASEFEDGSCAHRHILAHEMRHVQINQLTLASAADRMREGMQQSFGNKVYYGEPKELQERLTRHIREQWLPWVDAQMKHTLQRHREIDTPEEYARNRTACGGEIARTLDAMR
ncbi:hypothetical protein [Hydrogenophaga luteola]|uniref:DUF4157 domain-containing protein n=1 Tax=Hydrogenophaga luteola TaxID=1591122 RepID=A0ABV7W2A9_9BURK